MTRNRMNAVAGKKSVSRLLAVMLALVLCLSVMPISAAADGETTSTSLTYLALGDSITAGYGLDDASTEVFVTLLADEIGATATVNSGVSGLTAAQLYAALSAGNVQYDMAIAAADVITITIGGNDLMAAFYQIVADAYNSYISSVLTAQFGTDITVELLEADDVKNIFAGSEYSSVYYGYTVTVTASDLITQLQNIDSTALASNTTFQTAVAICVANINNIAAYIKSVNPDVTVLIANQYNPYLWLNSYLTEAGFGSFYNFDSVISLFETGVSYYNYMLSAGSTSDYTIVDVYSAFAASCLSDSSYAGKLTNAEVTYAFTTGVDYDFDFHPNAAGHRLIAATFASALSALEEESSETETEELTETEETTETEAESTETEETTETEELTETEETTGTEESTETEEPADTEAETTESEESASSTLTGTSEDGSMYYAITVDSADSSSYIIVEVSDESGSYIYANSNGTCYYVSASGETTDITDYTGELISLSEGETYSVTVDYDGSDVVISFYNEDGEVVLSYTVADTDMDDEITTTLSASDDAVITIDEASVETAETNSEEETDSEDSTDTEEDTNSEDDTDTEEDTNSEDSTDSEDTESAAGSDDTESGDTTGSNATGGSSSTASGTSSSPKTGDASPIIPIAVALLGCAAVVAVSKKRMA